MAISTPSNSVICPDKIFSHQITLQIVASFSPLNTCYLQNKTLSSFFQKELPRETVLTIFISETLSKIMRFVSQYKKNKSER